MYMYIIQSFSFCQNVSLHGRRTKGREGEVECEREARRAQSAIVGRSVGNACNDAIVFFVFYVHQMNAKILIGQS